jgi:hypothetical protein
MIRDEDEQLEDEFDFGTGYSDEPDFSEEITNKDWLATFEDDDEFDDDDWEDDEYDNWDGEEDQ